LVETPQDRKKREQNMAARAAGREDEVYYEGSDEEMLQAA
jgi:hypothetical protein